MGRLGGAGRRAVCLAGVMIAALGLLARAADAASGWTAYVANYGNNIVTRFNTAANVTFGTAIPVGTGPQAVAITPDGSTAYVGNSVGNSVTPINLTTNTAGTAIPVGVEPYGVAITPSGSTAYVPSVVGNSVTPINLATHTPGTAIGVGKSPAGIAITPNGSTAYVANDKGARSPRALEPTSSGPSDHGHGAGARRRRPPPSACPACDTCPRAPPRR